MRAAVFNGVRDIRVEHAPDPRIVQDTDAIVKVLAASICGSDLWFYRGIRPYEVGRRTGHEFLGIVDAVGGAVRRFRRGDVVVAPFAFSDGTCEFCLSGLQTSCEHGGYWTHGDLDGGQGEAVRVPLADSTLLQLPGGIESDNRLLRALLPLSDVMGTGHHAAVSAGVRPGASVVVVGDGAVGLCGVLASKRLGAEQIVMVGHHPDRLAIAVRFGATFTVNSRDPNAASTILEHLRGGAACVLECVGVVEALNLAIAVCRPGGTVGHVGIPCHTGPFDFPTLFARNISLRGGLAPVRHYMESLLPDVLDGRLDPSPVLDMTVTLADVAAGYAAMDRREAIKVLVCG